MQSANSRSWMMLQAQGKRGEDMLELSFSSCVSTLLFETAAIGLLAVFSGKIRTISERDARFVTGMLWTVILRLLFPVEFLYIQSDVCLARPWTEVYQKVTGEVGELGGQRYSLLGVGVIVSVSVSAVLALRLSVNLFRLRRMTQTQRLSYAQCLLDLARNSCALQGQWILPFGRRTELPVRVRALLYPAKGEDGKGSSGFKKCTFAVLLLFFGLFLPNFTVVKPYEPLPAQVMQIAQENDISGGYYVTSENGSYNIHVDGDLFRLNRGNRVTCKTAAPRRLNNLFHCHIKTVNPGNVFLKNRKYNDTLNK